MHRLYFLLALSSFDGLSFLPSSILFFKLPIAQVGLGSALNLATANVFSSLGLAAFVTG